MWSGTGIYAATRLSTAQHNHGSHELKIFALCGECLVEQGRPSSEFFILDYYDDGIAYATCSAGHKTAILVRNSKFETLLESGATALLEGFTLEACATFFAALERFYEFAMLVLCTAHGLSPQVYAKMFAGMARQSERQLGAFMLIHALEFGEAYKPDDKITKIRNSVIHKGTIPTPDEAHQFAARVYRAISSLYLRLHDKHSTHVINVRAQGLQEKHAKVPKGMRVSTHTGTMFQHSGCGYHD